MIVIVIRVIDIYIDYGCVVVTNFQTRYDLCCCCRCNGPSVESTSHVGRSIANVYLSAAISPVLAESLLQQGRGPAKRRMSGSRIYDDEVRIIPQAKGNRITTTVRR